MFRHALLSLAAVGVLASEGAAGWVVIKNETKAAVVIQEASDRPLGKRGKQVRLLPGEVYREFHLLSGEKKVHVFDPKAPDKPLCTTTLTWKSADVTFKVEVVAKAVTVSPAKPQVMLTSAEATKK